MTESEKGSDELLAEVGDPAVITEVLEADEHALADEEQRVAKTAPAQDEPGEGYPDPDETPDGDPPEYDPTPPPEEE